MVRRQQIHLPGNMRTMVKVSTSSAVLDTLEELCWEMGIRQPAVIEEFGLFGLVPQSKQWPSSLPKSSKLTAGLCFKQMQKLSELVN